MKYAKRSATLMIVLFTVAILSVSALSNNAYAGGVDRGMTLSAEVEIVDGHVIPEFGVIAAMILAVAIVSIIVVTAKTKLSIVPRY